MKLSEIYSAKGLKIKLRIEDGTVRFDEGILVRIEPTQDKRYFLVNQYGEGASSDRSVLSEASEHTSIYLMDLFEGEHENALRCMFIVDGVEDDAIEVQTYTFRTVTEYKTPISIVVSEELLEKYSVEKLSQEYTWTQLGKPALFCLNYKNKKKKNANIRFVGGKRVIVAQNTVRGIIANSVNYLKERFDAPVDIYVAPEIKFISEPDQAIVNDALSADLERISNPASYFARWEAYDALSGKMLEAESEEFGELSYQSFESRVEVNGTTYEFIVSEELDNSFKGKEVGACEKDSVGEQLNENQEYKKQVGVGQIRKIHGNKVSTFREADDSIDVVPSKGVLKLYTAGDRYIMKRRLAARDRMIKHQSPIKSIVALIETGTSGYELPSAWKSNKPVTDELKRNFKKAADLNQEQIKALNLAINTPDIALIQGPPGTGKTTVIKAICERFREIFEYDEKILQKTNPDHILRSPRILISSFQNEAVDNAISAPLPGDIPAYRKTAKRTKDSSKEQYQKSLDRWYAGLCSTINEMIEDAIAKGYVEKKRALDDEFLSYKNAGEPIEKAAALINHYLDYVEIDYPKDLVDSAKAILSAVSVKSQDDSVDPIVAKIEAQRTNQEAFEDDGSRNARKLAAYIRINDELDISEEVRYAIEKIADKDFTDEDFDAYVAAVKTLKKKYCGTRMSIDTKDKNKINECILSLGNTFSIYYMNTLTSVDSKKSLILSEFLSRLDQDYEEIVRKYSMTTAATCQTSLDLRDDVEKTYDLVVIDEAARANPLDLFIPMSMGRKIVLVGDHKQLPHMLEPDVLKLLAEDPKFNDLPEIEKSLFERLFDMFSGGQKTKAVSLTYQFRMHPDICRFVSDSFYDGMLQTAKTITPESRSSPLEINNGKALTYVNVPISRGPETSGVSKSRWAEVEAIGKDVKKVLEVAPKATIGIITFYSAQAILIRRHLDSFLNDEQKTNIEIGTVDAFQGKEFEYVLLSCVRSNSQKSKDTLPNVGFLSKPNRLCVAFSRSIRQLTVYADADTLMQIPCFEKLYEICAINGGGCYREY